MASLNENGNMENGASVQDPEEGTDTSSSASPHDFPLIDDDVSTALNNNSCRIEDGKEIDSLSVASAETTKTSSRRIRLVEPNTCSEDGQELNWVSSCEWKEGSWVCQPYKVEVLQGQMTEAKTRGTRRKAVIETLRKFGVKVFIIDGAKSKTSNEVLNHVRRIIRHVVRENSALGNFKRCLLYQDKQGRLFNLSFSEHAVGPLGQWRESMDSFSVTEALVAFMILCRSFPCIVEEELIEGLRPAYLSLILGLVLTEEISHSLLNTSMMVRGMPSTSAHYFVSPFAPDLLRKIVIFCLATAGATTGVLQSTLTLLGIALACLTLLANLGSRAWHFLGWRPFRYNGPFALLAGYVMAIFTGLMIPYLGHRRMSDGGKAAMEAVVKSALLVAVCFILSDYDDIQKFLVVGSENCNQDLVNLCGGVWWSVSLIFSLLILRSVAFYEEEAAVGERLLKSDHTSPVGFKVPKLPDFELDPCCGLAGSRFLSLHLEFAIGIVLAIVLGILMVSFSFTDWEDNAYDAVQDYMSNIF